MYDILKEIYTSGGAFCYLHCEYDKLNDISKQMLETHPIEVQDIVKSKYSMYEKRKHLSEYFLLKISEYKDFLMTESLVPKDDAITLFLFIKELYKYNFDSMESIRGKIFSQLEEIYK